MSTGAFNHADLVTSFVNYGRHEALGLKLKYASLLILRYLFVCLDFAGLIPSSFASAQ